MKTVVGIFKSQEDAVHAVDVLPSSGISSGSINVLFPTPVPELEMEQVRTADTEQPGVGKALGGVVGGAAGLAGGMELGTAIASIFVPGVGPVLAAGFAGAALLGAAGVAAGTAAGESVENFTKEGLAKDEVFVYEDALRQGRTVVIVFAEDERADVLREILSSAGAETVDAARHQWWLGLRDAEREKYAAPHRDFERDEEVYRAGFESALHPSARGRSYDEAASHLQWFYPRLWKLEAFQRGFESGRLYYQEFCRRTRSRPAA